MSIRHDPDEGPQDVAGKVCGRGIARRKVDLRQFDGETDNSAKDDGNRRRRECRRHFLVPKPCEEEKPGRNEPEDVDGNVLDKRTAEDESFPWQGQDGFIHDTVGCTSKDVNK